MQRCRPYDRLDVVIVVIVRPLKPHILCNIRCLLQHQSNSSDSVFGLLLGFVIGPLLVGFLWRRRVGASSTTSGLIFCCLILHLSRRYVDLAAVL